jgi:1-aminocyclopropane-1-carboxylate deaminase
MLKEIKDPRSNQNNSCFHMLQMPSIPLQELRDPRIKGYGVQVLVKRDDLIHPQISGNKWRKLKYNLVQASKLGKNTLLTFGGAYSNHILATAAAGKLMGVHTIGIIRGEEHLPLNSTLAFASQAGMDLHYIDRESYRNKRNNDFIEKLHQQFGDFYLVPEGGSNAYAVQGCAEIVAEIDTAYDYICCACGTGGTIAGIIAGLEGNKRVLGFPALKGAVFLYDDIRELLQEYAELSTKPEVLNYDNWQLNLDYHFGGYAKTSPELLAFVEEFEQVNGFAIEPIYTGKMFFGLYDLIKKGYFRRGDTVVAIHTGGLRNF